MKSTLHYKLKVFDAGDVFLGSADRQRFTIIDNQISFLTEQIGDGVISGWGIEALGGTRVRVKSGIGIIDTFATETYGYYDFDLPDNDRWYFFIRRKPDVVSDLSAFSQLANVSYTDATPPATPATPTLVERKYNYVKIRWTANTEPDFQQYELYRSTNGISYALLDTATANSYTDEDVVSGQIYYYKLLARDENNLASGFSSVLVTSTEVDSRIPSDPANLEVINGDETLQVLWDAGAFLVNGYKVTLQPIDTEGQNDGAATTHTLSSTTFSYVFKALDNGQNYLITVQSISAHGVLSSGVSVKGQPVYTGGPQEIDDFVYSDFAVDSSWNVAINLSWSLQDNEYLANPAYYIVTVQNGSEVGDPSIYLDTSIVLHRYTVNGVERKIHEKTKYTIKVQTVDADGDESRGYLIRIKTNKYSPPGPILNFSADATYTLTTKSLTASWKNTASDFAYNELTVTRTTLGTSPTTTTIESARNYGQAEFYSLAKSQILNQCSYTFTLTTYDSYGNASDATGGTVIINETFGNSVVPSVGEITGARPPAPEGLSSISGDDLVTIYWNPVISDNISKYRIWRSDYTPGSLQSDDFQMIAEVDSDLTKFIDYDVDNGSRYFYFVTTLDTFGQESANPNDGFIDYIFATGEPRSNSQLSKPPVLSVTAVGHNAVIGWHVDPDSFDGFEIWRSIGSKTAFEKIGTIDSFATSYTDTNALHKSGTYYYAVRKFREEAEILLSRTKVVPIGSLLLGNVVVSSGVSTPNTEAAVDLTLLVDPIIAEVKKQFQQPTHLYKNTRDDRRIRLSDTLVVEDWVSTDFTVYTSQIDMRGTDQYIVYVNGLQTGFASRIDTDTGTLTFEAPIYDVVADTAAEVAEPTVVVVFQDVGEVEGILPEENIGEILADKISKGKLTHDALPQFDHFGRFREPCQPVQFPAVRINGAIYQTTTPTGITFYDIYRLPDGRTMAATPEGVRITLAIDGVRWETVLTTDLPVTKLYYSSTYDWYMALSGSDVYYSIDLEDWVKIPGIASGNVVRDIAEDGMGNIFVSCDGGVYRASPDEYIKVSWDQCELADPTDNRSYALWYESGYLYVSVTGGIYRSNSAGEVWTKVSGDELQVPIYSTVRDGSYLYLASNNKVWRKPNNQAVYSTISVFPYSIRKLAVFAGDIYVTTDHGLYRSDPTQAITTASPLRFSLAFKSLQRNGFMPCVHALRIFNSRLYMGLDERIYSASSQRKIVVNANVPGICPIIFLDGHERNVGIYYGSRNRIVFDTRLDPTASVTIVRDYVQYNLLNGGWADTKYDAELTLILNGVEQATASTVKPKTTATYIAQQLKQIVTPSFNARTANFNDALKYLKQIVQLVDAVNTEALLRPTGSIDAALVASIYKAVNLFRVNLSPELSASVVLPPIGGSATTTSGISFTYDAVNGTLTLTTGATKYTRVQLSIKGVGLTGIGTLTHKEIDDRIEIINSGLPSSLASVQQANVVKMGIYNQVVDPGGLVGYQSKFFGCCDDFYDRLASTVDYTLRLEQMPTEIVSAGIVVGSGSFSINYPADVLHVADENEVWVCGAGGIIAVDTSTYECSKVIANEFYFFNMSLSDGVVYALAEDGLYLIDVATREITKDVDLELPEGFSSVIRFGNTTYIATKDGLFFRRTGEPQWTKLFDIKNAIVRSGQQLTFCIGQDPNDEDTSVIYYSHSGVVWNRSTQLSGYMVSGATQRGDSIYYATDNGLVVEDLSNLFAQEGGPEIIASRPRRR
jgi:fibronectin type 3 domain-containing protein